MSGVDGFMAVERKFGADLGRRLASRLRSRSDWQDFEADPAHAIFTAGAMLKAEREDRGVLDRMEQRHRDVWGTPRPKSEAEGATFALAYTRTWRDANPDFGKPRYAHRTDPDPEIHTAEVVTETLAQAEPSKTGSTAPNRGED